MIDAVAALGNPGLCATTVVLFALWLWLAGLPRMVFGFTLGFALVGLATLALKWLVATPGATLWPDGALVSQYFPSGHTALATAIYGSLAMALAYAGGGRWRYTPVFALVLAGAVAVARVAARAHPAGDVLAGMTIGMIGPASTYLGVIREVGPLPAAGRILGVFLTTLLLGWLLPAPIGDLLH